MERRRPIAARQRREVWPSRTLGLENRLFEEGSPYPRTSLFGQQFTPWGLRLSRCVLPTIPAPLDYQTDRAASPMPPRSIAIAAPMAPLPLLRRTIPPSNPPPVDDRSRRSEPQALLGTFRGGQRIDYTATASAEGPFSSRTTASGAGV